MSFKQTIKAIETVYAGYRFRSRLEARWAVFFDAAGIKWDYEPEGFYLDGVRYLPDFFLLDQEIYIEIKPRGFYGGRYDSDEMRKTQEKLKKLATGSGCNVFLIIGSPNPDRWSDDRDDCPRVIGFAPNKGVISSKFFECPHCQCVSLMLCAEHGFFSAICPCQGSEAFEDTNYNPFKWPPRLRHAMVEGRQARFEHGETGPPRMEER
jgi:hypothetical protein